MENSLTFNDIKLLLLQKKWVIVSLTAICSILFGVYAFYSVYINNDEENTAIIEEPVEESEFDMDSLLNTDAESLTEDELAFIDEALFEEAYSFRIYIENQDGSVYDRSNLLTELLTSSDTLSSIEEQTSVELEAFKDHFLNIDLNSSNVVYTITVGLGDEQINEEVSQAYYAALENDEIEIINNKLTKIFGSPERVDSEQIIEGPVSSKDNEESVTDVIVALIIGGFFGFGISIFLVFIYTLLERKINPIYNYRLSEQDRFINFSHIKISDSELYESLMHTVLYPTSNRKLIISQDKHLNSKINSTLEEELGNQSLATTNVSEIDPSLDFNELIIITENKLTEKQWYIKQKNQLRTYDKPFQIIKLR